MIDDPREHVTPGPVHMLRVQQGRPALGCCPLQPRMLDYVT